MNEANLLGVGATARVYLEDGKAVKLYLGGSRHAAEKEVDAQRFARAAGLPVPEVFGVEDRADGIALVMQCVDGAPLMRPGMDRAARADALATLVALQRRTHAVPAPSLIPLAERLAGRLHAAPGIDTPLRDTLLTRLGNLASDERQLCHGDFHPLNVLCEGGEPWIIDWMDATAGAPLADACRTYVILRRHIPRMAGLYLKAYCKAAGVKDREVLAWLPVVAAARLMERVDERERAMLTKMIAEG